MQPSLWKVQLPCQLPYVQKGCKILNMQHWEYQKLPWLSTVCHNGCPSCRLLCHCLWNASNVRCARIGLVSWYSSGKVWRIVLPLLSLSLPHMLWPICTIIAGTETFHYIWKRVWCSVISVQILAVVSVSLCHQQINKRYKIQHENAQRCWIFFMCNVSFCSLLLSPHVNWGTCVWLAWDCSHYFIIWCCIGGDGCSSSLKSSSSSSDPVSSTNSSELASQITVLTPNDFHKCQVHCTVQLTANICGHW